MKTLIVICLTLPILVFSQEDSLSDSTSLAVADFSQTDTLHVPEAAPIIIDTVNVTDSLGMKQGYWMFLGGEFPNSGVASSEILEDGKYYNNQRIGRWYRYGHGGQITAVMNYRYDPKTKTSARDQFYYYEHYPNGKLKRKPAVGACRTTCDYYRYDENESLTEVELFDSLCNTSFKLQRIQKGEMDSISIFIVDQKFHEPTASLEETAETIPGFGQTGEFCLDFNHRIFQVGRFENGTFVEGREFLVDEMMRAQRVHYFEGGRIVKTLVK